MNSKANKIIAILISVVMTLSVNIIPVMADTARPTLYFDKEYSVAAGETVTVDLSIKNNAGFGGLDCQIFYDENLLTCIDKNAKIDSEGNQTLIAMSAPNIGPKIPTNNVSIIAASGEDAIVGDGHLAQITFEAASDIEGVVPASLTIKVNELNDATLDANAIALFVRICT